MRRSLLALAAATIAVGAGAQTAAAATVGPFGSASFRFEASPGEQNDVAYAITASAITVTERTPGVVLTPVAPCVATSDPRTVTCPGGDPLIVNPLVLELHDQDDRCSKLPGSVIGVYAYGGPGNDTLESDGLAEGNTGDDSLEGHGSLSGGSGNDSLRSEGGTLAGGFGDDSIVGSGVYGVYADGGPGDDRMTLRSSGGNSGLGGPGDDVVQGSEGNDSLLGGPGDDLLVGAGGSDRIGFTDSLSGFVPTSESGNDTLLGGPGPDMLYAGPGPGPEGSDSDFISAGEGGWDQVTYSAVTADDPVRDRTAGVDVSVDGRANDGAAGENDNVRGDFEFFEGGEGDDHVVGGPRPEFIDGSGGTDFLEGAGGGDRLEGGNPILGGPDTESDTMVGGPGPDVLVGREGDDGLFGEGGEDTLLGAAGDDLLDGGEDSDRLFGGPGTDQLLGGAGDDGLFGQDGDDGLRGDAGDDDLHGGADDDRLAGGEGDDRMAGGAGRDLADYSFSPDDVSVSLDGEADDGVPGERDNVLPDVEDVAGGELADTFTGSGAANELDGRKGEDYVDGQGGSDRLRGGSAVDVARARDGGTPDSVSCGRARDFAIVDPADTVADDCEAFDNGLNQVPALGETVVVNPVEGRNRFGPPEMRRSVPLQDRLKLPLESKVDATRGEVSLASARSRSSRQSGRFYGGAFEVDQEDSDSPYTVLRLRGGDFSQCASAGRATIAGLATAARKKKVRRLWGKAKGKFKTKGRNSSASVRGTEFLVEDRCDGTLTRVREGTVVVRDFTLDKTIVLNAGDSYLAKAP